MCVAGLPVARYVYSLGTGEASSDINSVVECHADNVEVPSPNLGYPTTRAGSSKVRKQAVTAMRVKASANNP